MASTKNLRTIVAASTSNAAGGTTTGTAVNLTTAYGGYLTAKLINGGTGPTVACTMSVLVSGDNSNWKTAATYSGDTVNSSTFEWGLEIPPGVMYVNVQFTGNTGQAVTVEAFLHELTTI